MKRVLSNYSSQCNVLAVPEEYQIIKTAIDILDFFTCIEFKEWDGERPDYLIIWPVEKPNGCWSYGMEIMYNYD